MKTIKTIIRTTWLLAVGFIIGLIAAPLLAIALPFCFAWDAATDAGIFKRED